MLAFVGTAVFVGAALVVDDFRVESVTLVAALVCWTVFVQDHMAWRKK